MPKAFDPFASPWRGNRRTELIRRYVTPGSLDEDGIGEAFVALTFTAPPDEQWDVILEVIEAAPEDADVMGRIAAGPLEGLLGRHGADVIARVEARARTDAKFRRILAGVWKYTMADDIWARVCAARTSPMSRP